MLHAAHRPYRLGRRDAVVGQPLDGLAEVLVAAQRVARQIQAREARHRSELLDGDARQAVLVQREESVGG